MSANVLKQELKKGIVRNIYLIYGEEEYLKKLYSDKIERVVLEGGMGDLNKFVLEEPKEISKIESLCETLPCFSERKFILVKNSGYFKSSRKEKKSLRDSLYELVNNLPLYVCVVFLEKDIDKRLKLVKAVEEKGMVVEFGVQPQNILLKWIVDDMKRRGKIIHPDIAFRIIQYCNFSMNAISNEMNKLELYLDERDEITDVDVENVCTKDISIKIFDLIDNIVAKRSDMAFKNLKDMIIMKEPIPRIIFMIVKHFTQLLDIKMLLEDGLNIRDCIVLMKLAPYAANKMAKQVSSFEVDYLKRKLEEILMLDYKIKMGSIKDVLAVQLLLVSLCDK